MEREEYSNNQQNEISKGEDYYLLANAVVGPADSLYKFLRASLARACKARFLVAFITESGARLLAKLMAAMVERGGTIEILTGTYLNITEPYALGYLLDKVPGGLEIRAYHEVGRSFHPKAYFFDHEDDSEVFVGSANLSWTALTTGVEWSYRLRKSRAPADYGVFLRSFQDLYDAGRLVDSDFLDQYYLKWKGSN